MQIMIMMLQFVKETISDRENFVEIVCPTVCVMSCLWFLRKCGLTYSPTQLAPPYTAY